jgi:hypothetical protein
MGLKSQRILLIVAGLIALCFWIVCDTYLRPFEFNLELSPVVPEVHGHPAPAWLLALCGVCAALVLLSILLAILIARWRRRTR